MPSSLDAVERRLREDHDAVVETVGRCADAVADEWDDAPAGERWTTDRDGVVPPFERALDAAGVLVHLPRVLSDLVTVTGQPMPAPPVAAPPYVAVTSRGIVLRASLPDGRLVVSLDVFGVERGEAVRYVRLDGVDVRVERRR